MIFLALANEKNWFMRLAPILIHLLRFFCSLLYHCYRVIAMREVFMKTITITRMAIQGSFLSQHRFFSLCELFVYNLSSNITLITSFNMNNSLFLETLYPLLDDREEYDLHLTKISVISIFRRSRLAKTRIPCQITKRKCRITTASWTPSRLSRVTFWTILWNIIVTPSPRRYWVCKVIIRLLFQILTIISYSWEIVSFQCYYAVTNNHAMYSERKFNGIHIRSLVEFDLYISNHLHLLQLDRWFTRYN